jgi:tetratricopeptide (TPR) repeat protein
MKTQKSYVILIAAALSLTAMTRASETAAAMEAFELRMNGKTAEAVELLKKAVKEDPSDAAAHFELCRDYFYTLMEAVENTEGDIKAKQLALKNRLDLAKKHIEQAVKIDPENARYRYWHGIIVMYEVVYDAHFPLKMLSVPFEMQESLNSFEKALELNPDFHKARYMLAGLYDRNPWFLGGSKTKSEKLTRQLEQASPVHGAISRCELKPEKKPHEKIAIWLNVVEKLPNNPNAHHHLARAYLEGGNERNAMKHIKKTIELDPGQSYILLHLAKYHKNCKNYEKELQYLDSYIHQTPPPPAPLRALAFRMLAQTHGDLGGDELKKQMLETAEHIDPVEVTLQPWVDIEEMLTAP